jgi:DNA-binding HxlR family transcriptional regulator
MLDYGQYCPVAKAAEVLGEKWALLVIRELLKGRSRFTELQHGLSRISPTMLTKRLNELCDAGLVARKRIRGQRGHEYFLTTAGRELDPIVRQLGVWGMRWVRGRMSDADLDVYLLMNGIQQRIDPNDFVGRETVLRFELTNVEDYRLWWLVVDQDDVDLCTDDPGKEVDVYLATDLRTLTEIWMGDASINAVRHDGRLKVSGPSALLASMRTWFPLSPYAGIKAARRQPVA